MLKIHKFYLTQKHTQDSNENTHLRFDTNTALVRKIPLGK